MTPESKPIDRAIVRRVISLFGPHRKQVMLMMGTVMVAVILGLIPPFLLQVIIDRGLQKNNLGVVTEYSLLTIVITLCAASSTLLYGYQSVVIGQKIMCDMRRHLFTHLQGMSLRFFTQTKTGDIQTRLISDIGGVQNVVSNTFVDALSNIAIVISALVSMFIIDWRLTLLAVTLIPVFMIIGQKVGDFAKDIRLGVQEQTSEINSLMQENLSVSGALLAKTIGRADQIAQKFDVENNSLARWQVKASVLQYTFFGIFRMITQVIPALIYWLAGYLLHRGDTHLTVGVLVAFTMLQTRMFFPLTGLFATQVEILGSFALFERIFEYMDVKHDIVEAPNAVEVDKSKMEGRVTFSNVGFKYDQNGEDWTLKDVSFEAKPGQLIALVGASGAGKTTLTYMIPRLYDVDEGQVSIDGVDVENLKLDNLAEVVGAVTQETYLVHATIRENLQIAKPEATDDELIEACKAAAIHEHIAGLPEGYSTVVGERGYKLSGGEKQRIAIARAILKNPKILILDEATSALDTHSERLIQQSLNNLMAGRTTFAIAHRLSTILNADQILVMSDGRLVESGRHQELMALQGTYYHLYTQQFESHPI
ncbi:MAG: ATP-binding cassette domain-containing protein [Armatimonadetes bacterium]|nr:ATP-binding cassette domain-containing protein [Armatimonadota bacterium]MBS1727173.1 ABC transporter ATP-binding protein [Armatimonadota bacterium]